ncbi:MAG: hypothetical protein KBF93_26200 [Leptospiraceae bacterium]|nr:hypothetical protein [Leptospiraceae bacterium]
MEIKGIITIILILFFFTNLVSEVAKGFSDKLKRKPSQWSDYFGSMNWFDANDKCQSIKMRLPTEEELKQAFATKVTELWKIDGRYYWTGHAFPYGFAYGFDIINGITTGDDMADIRHVRCTRLNDPRIPYKNYSEQENSDILEKYNTLTGERKICVNKFLQDYRDKIHWYCAQENIGKNIGLGCFRIANVNGTVHTAVLEKAMAECKDMN